MKKPHKTEYLNYYTGNSINPNNSNLQNTLNPESSDYEWKRTSDDTHVSVNWNEVRNVFVVTDENQKVYESEYFEFYRNHTFRKNNKKFNSTGDPSVGYILILNAMQVINKAEGSGLVPQKIDKNKAIENYVANRFDDLSYALSNSRGTGYIQETITEALSY